MSIYSHSLGYVGILDKGHKKYGILDMHLYSLFFMGSPWTMPFVIFVVTFYVKNVLANKKLEKTNL